MNAVKFGERCKMPTPSQACSPVHGVQEGVETRRLPSRTDEGIVQTTNPRGGESRSGRLSSKSLVRAQPVGQNGFHCTKFDTTLYGAVKPLFHDYILAVYTWACITAVWFISHTIIHRIGP